MTGSETTSAHVGGASTSDHAAATSRSTLAVSATAVLLLVCLALPFVFLPITEDVAGAHTAFHVVGIVVCGGGWYVLHLLRRGATRTVKVMAWIVSAFLAAWVLGHIGELVAVLADGGPAHDSHTFDDPVHIFFANISVPSWMLTVVGLVVLLATIGIQAIVRRTRGGRRTRS